MLWTLWYCCCFYKKLYIASVCPAVKVIREVHSAVTSMGIWERKCQIAFHVSLMNEGLQVATPSSLSMAQPNLRVLAVPKWICQYWLLAQSRAWNDSVSLAMLDPLATARDSGLILCICACVLAYGTCDIVCIISMAITFTDMHTYIKGSSNVQ